MNPIKVRKNNQPNNHLSHIIETNPQASLSDDETENYYQAFENDDEGDEDDGNDDDENEDDEGDGNKNVNNKKKNENKKGVDQNNINKNKNNENENENEDEDLALALELSKQTLTNDSQNIQINDNELQEKIISNSVKYSPLIDEPSSDEPNVTKISFRLLFTPTTTSSSSSANIRRFHLNSSVEQFYSYIYSLLPPTDKDKKFDLFTPFPRESISSKIHLTIQEAGLSGSQIVMKWE